MSTNDLDFASAVRPLPASADVVVVGSGALGASVAYHVAALGQPRVVLLDRFAIPSQTSARAQLGSRYRCAERTR